MKLIVVSIVAASLTCPPGFFDSHSPVVALEGAYSLRHEFCDEGLTHLEISPFLIEQFHRPDAPAIIQISHVATFSFQFDNSDRWIHDGIFATSQTPNGPNQGILFRRLDESTFEEFGIEDTLGPNGFAYLYSVYAFSEEPTIESLNRHIAEGITPIDQAVLFPCDTRETRRLSNAPPSA